MVKLSRDEGLSSINIVLFVAIGMILVGILFPLFMWMLGGNDISEPMRNLAAICEAQEAYKAKHQTYYECKESPANGGTDNILDPWVDEGTPGKDAFADIGFVPEGPVRYKYAVTNATERSFVAIAIGDLDGDGEPSSLVVSRDNPRYPKPQRMGDRW